MDLFAHEPTEEWVFQLLRPALSAEMDICNTGIDYICAEKGDNYTSICFLTHEIVSVDNNGKIIEKTNKHLAFRICSRGNHHYFGVPTNLLALASDDILSRTTTLKSDPAYSRCRFDPTPDGVEQYSDYLRKVLESAVDAIPKEFDCCSRVEACSDAKKCLNPNPDLAITCGYRKIMKSGRIFYGKNRNID